MTVEVRNLIFDLGGVLYDIDLQATVTAFLKLIRSREVSETLKRVTFSHPVFLALEKGEVSPEEFPEVMRSSFGIEASDEEIYDAWNALLLGPAKGAGDAVAALAVKYNVVLLSNTNEIHYRVFEPQCREMFGAMQKCFFSFRLNLRKPQAEIYNHVLDKMNWKNSETLFLDDSPVNIDGAIACGINTKLVDRKNNLSAVFNALIRS